MTNSEFEKLTLTQLAAEMGVLKRTVTLDVDERRKAMQWEVFQRICQAQGIHPRHLAVQPKALLGEWLKQAVKSRVDIESVMPDITKFSEAHT